MDKLEYIPGDLVMVKESALQFAKDKIFKVISSLSGGFLNVVMLNDSSTTYSISNNSIRPIPLTTEILEKNGWVKDTHRHCLDEMPAEAYEKKDFPLTHFNVNFGKKKIQASHDCLFVRNLKYVSDLQHLLFGLGLSSGMEV